MGVGLLYTEGLFLLFKEMAMSLEISQIKKLAADLRLWGKAATIRVRRLTRKHGVLCDSTVYSTGSMG